MNTNCDENSWYLSEFLHNEEVEHQKWLDTLPEKREAVIEFAKVILQEEVSDDLFFEVFKDWWDFDKEEYNPFILHALNTWGAIESDPYDYEIIRSLGLKALEYACEDVIGETLAVISVEGNWNIDKMLTELVGEPS